MSNNISVKPGTAIIEIKRIKKSCRSSSRFLSEFFSPDEIMFFVKHAMSPQLIAENYCIKIAFAKAVGTGMRFIKAKDISVLRDTLGSPFVIASGYAKMLLERENYSVNVSVSHCKDYAVGTVILSKD